MNTRSIIPIILAGGHGRRLWPLSMKCRPKQFLPLFGGKTLFEATLDRVKDHSLFTSPMIVCAQRHHLLIQDFLHRKQIKNATIISEEYRLDTAPAIYNAIKNYSDKTDDIFLILPSDHIIPDVSHFLKAMREAHQTILNHDEKIITFGIQPTHASINFGYIRAGKNNENDNKVFHISEFKEKPDVTRAAAYIANGDYLWNSGIFMMTRQTALQNYETYAPDITDNITETPIICFNRAVLEKTNNAYVMPVSFEWHDIGSWRGLYQARNHFKFRKSA